MTQAGKPLSIHLEAFGLTDRGQVRSNNQDQYLIGELCQTLAIRASSLEGRSAELPLGSPLGYVLVVADGMGGHAAGERASALAVQTVIEYLTSLLPWLRDAAPELDDSYEEKLRTALKKSNERVLAESHAQPHSHGMGITLTLACALWPSLYLVHVGDSRCYLLRDRELIRLTRDQTIAQELLDSGALSQLEAESAGFGHVLTSAIGGDSDEIDPTVSRVRMESEDLLLLCTDGLTTHLHDEEIARLLASGKPAESICHDLVEAANAAGGRDNVTVIVARFSDSEDGGGRMSERASSSMEDEETAEMPPVSA